MPVERPCGTSNLLTIARFSLSRSVSFTDWLSSVNAQSLRLKMISNILHTNRTYVKNLTLKMKVKVMQYNIRNGAIPWQISTSVKVIWCIFAIALAVSEILMFQICDLEKIDQGHKVQHLQWFHSIVNIDLFKSHTWAFFASTHPFRDIHISTFLPWKCTSSTPFTLVLFDDNYLTSYLMATVISAFSNIYLSK